MDEVDKIAQVLGTDYTTVDRFVQYDADGHMLVKSLTDRAVLINKVIAYELALSGQALVGSPTDLGLKLQELTGDCPYSNKGLVTIWNMLVANGKANVDGRLLVSLLDIKSEFYEYNTPVEYIEEQIEPRDEAIETIKALMRKHNYKFMGEIKWRDLALSGTLHVDDIKGYTNFRTGIVRYRNGK